MLPWFVSPNDYKKTFESLKEEDKSPIYGILKSGTWDKKELNVSEIHHAANCKLGQLHKRQRAQQRPGYAAPLRGRPRRQL